MQIYTFQQGRERDALEIGDLDDGVRVDLCVARRLGLDVAVELFEEDLVAQELGAGHCTEHRAHT